MRPALRALLFSGAAFNPLDLFAGGYTGFYYEFSKTDRTFQESTGPTPADDATEPVGLALDGRLWDGKTFTEIMAAQPERVANGTFDLNTAGVTSGNSATLSASAGQLVVTNAVAFFGYGYIAVATTIGKIYRAKIEVVSASNAWVARIGDDSSATTNQKYSATGTTSGSLLDVSFVATAATTYIRIGNNTNTIGHTSTFDNVSVKEIPSIPATQTTAGSRPTREAGGVFRFNGTAHNLLTTLNPSATFSMVAKVTPNSDADLRVITGSSAASDGKVAFGFDASGNFCASVGADTASTIKGSTNRNGAVCIVGLAYDGQRVHLYENREQTYGAAQNGAANTTVPLRVGANNANGTAGDFFGGDLSRLFAVNRFLTPSDMQNFVNFWGLS